MKIRLHVPRDSEDSARQLLHDLGVEPLEPLKKSLSAIDSNVVFTVGNISWSLVNNFWQSWLLHTAQQQATQKSQPEDDLTSVFEDAARLLGHKSVTRGTISLEIDGKLYDLGKQEDRDALKQHLETQSDESIRE